jgi:type I restriction enzyme S subunit
MNKYQSYKPSGIDWIGVIPEHWEKNKIKYLFKHKKGVNVQKLTNEYICENPGIYTVYSCV